MNRGTKPRNLSYGPHQRHALSLVRDLTRQLDDAERLLDAAVLHAWKQNCALTDIGAAGRYEGDNRLSAQRWAMRARDRAMARARIQGATASKVH